MNYNNVESPTDIEYIFMAVNWGSNPDEGVHSTGEN